jgi:hypothetical protein
MISKVASRGGCFPPDRLLALARHVFLLARRAAKHTPIAQGAAERATERAGLLGAEGRRRDWGHEGIASGRWRWGSTTEEHLKDRCELLRVHFYLL